MTAQPSPLRCVVLGCGVVGTEVVRRLLTDRDDLAARAGTAIELTGIGVRNPDAMRDPVVPVELLSSDLEALVDSADLVVELMGGIDPARALIQRAFEAGASVVTANKALLASHGPALHEAADAAHASLLYEAAVAGAVPVVRGIRESLVGDRIQRVIGIVNGTTNYILDQMTTTGLDFQTALTRAQELGYAEADPSADVDGLDAGAKAAILASLAFHTRVSAEDVPTEGIRSVTAADINAAAATGDVIKLLAIAEMVDDGIAVRVHPALVPLDHPLAGVRGAYNAVFIEAESSGTLMFYGQGAGGAPTSAAVLGDIVDAARSAVGGGRAPAESNYLGARIVEPGLVPTRYLIRLEVVDRPGVLAEIATVVSEHDVSIETVRQTSIAQDRSELAIVTHQAEQALLDATMATFATLEPVTRIISILRVEGH
ncbi:MULTISPECIES: homoserine dehydrogenase [unclassified Pseudactinotalea]|uniref:homoserine dehydrogenase n=1 Tax=unclassified Pseudactinotalea TaxID=2649176 RepID=UPI00128CC53B|nr:MULTISPECIES: homoserine dehydrogenase [unclassified Pseudactinotalea]MPV48904.1 homoserine dehydrogenase [Pseudactinotalea sp. HY160]QGH68881.1 homoserine dehydrogenase [Pseudactinotalea sp. HY158]